MAMISFTEAYLQVLEHNVDYGTETMPLNSSRGRILAAAVTADRDLPPFHRATKDGIALNYRAVESGREAFEIKGIIPAGDAVSVLDDQDSCMEIMTGAVVPLDADTVVMYEKIDSDDGIARLLDRPRKGQNIHRRGSDAKKGDVLLASGTRITAAEVGILASVGCTKPLVRKLPSVAVISTGNEIIPIDQDPLPQEIL